ncbi:hypothetical protein SKAU_G00322860 [Synaphobranchus kaupii]|uniref:Cadherin domain-containing protein n=1 Tax=Synaphobranchus kaupii TaxID=118154 RepID=A0A9Q1IHT5_SYNKA|nr:hypothetical protein SKAU_G00322860 [Synaphobranchus kaupii]
MRVQRDISESDAMKQNLVISVKDNGQPSLSATCAVYLLISDNLAEVPQLKDMSYEENNSKLTSYLIIALVSVSTFFLTFIILMVAVRFCRRRKPRLLFDGAVAIPSAYFPPNYAEVEGAGTLRSSYNYDAYLTTGSRTSDFKFVGSYNNVTMAADQTLKRSPNEISEAGAVESAEIVKSTDPGLFTIGVHSGEIRVQRDISESDAMKQNLVISVKDNGQPSLSATCAVYLLISDNLAEVPHLKDMSYEENNSKLTSYLIIALVSVSTFFLTFIILMVAVRFCRRRKPRLLFDGAVAIPSAYFPPNYAEVEGAGTLRSSYNYDAYLTTGSRTSDFNFVGSYNDVTMAADQTLKRSPNEISEGGAVESAEVIAVDPDSGQNAWLSYQIVKSTDPGLFTIGVHNGEIRVQRDISESDAMKQNLVISVKDNGQPSLSATCAVYLLISDNLAEVPQLKDMSYEESNSKLTSYLIIALVSVSTFFLTFIILMVAVRFCRRRKPRLLFDGAVAIPSAYFPPNYAEVEGAGTLRSSYNYDAYLTTGSRTSDFNFVGSYNDVTIAADQTLKRSPNEISEGGAVESAEVRS